VILRLHPRRPDPRRRPDSDGRLDEYANGDSTRLILRYALVTRISLTDADRGPDEYGDTPHTCDSNCDQLRRHDNTPTATVRQHDADASPSDDPRRNPRRRRRRFAVQTLTETA
jgi:hypothetical protein